MDVRLIDELTPEMVARGVKVYQIHRFADSDYEHVKRLERWAEIPLDAHVIDLGSGVGEVAKVFSSVRRDLVFTLVNVSSEQLRYSPREMEKIHASFLKVPRESEEYDAALFCFAIGHEKHEDALKEAHRILKKGGVLFIYDMVRVSGSNETMVDVEYKVLPRGEMEKLASLIGFKSDVYIEPHDDGKYGVSVLGDSFHTVFQGTIPAIWRFIKI